MQKPKQEKRFEYKGIPCVILFMPMGYRCGYVGLPKGIAVDTESIRCHGGITYTSGHLYHQEDTDRLWIGFDCGHYFDGFDIEKIKEYFSEDAEAMKVLLCMRRYYESVNQEYGFRTLEYCEEQCRDIVDQIVEIQEEEHATQ